MKGTHGTREAQQIKLLADRLKIITVIVKRKKLSSTFEPSMKTLSRILKIMVDNGPDAKTSLSLGANLNYARLAKHIVWLEKKGFVKSTVDDSKISVGLSEKGRMFASTLSSD